MSSLGFWDLWALMSCGLFLLVRGQHPQSSHGDSGRWRQMIQWENNGRVYSLLNTGSEYVPASHARADSNARVMLADAATNHGRRVPGNTRRQAPTLPARVGSDTVRGNTRHPFGFGQVPDNWRDGATGDSGSNSHRARSPATRQRQVGSASSSSSSFSHSSFGQLYPQASYPQPPFVNQYEAYDPQAPRAYDETYTYYRTAGGGAVAAAAASAGVIYPFQPRVRYEEYAEDQNPYRAQGHYPTQERPYIPQQLQPSDGLDRRYSHSLYHDTGTSYDPSVQDPYASSQGQQSLGQGVPVADNLHLNNGAPVSAGSRYGNEPWAGQYPPFGEVPLDPHVPPRNVEPQPPFRPLDPHGVPRPEPYLPIRNSEPPQLIPDSQGVSQPRVSVGSIYRPNQNGRGESLAPWLAGGMLGRRGSGGALWCGSLEKRGVRREQQSLASTALLSFQGSHIGLHMTGAHRVGNPSKHVCSRNVNNYHVTDLCILPSCPGTTSGFIQMGH